VCKKKGKCDFRKIQKAVKKAKAGDTIRVRNGVYREAVSITGKKKRYLKVVGNPKKPRKVVLRARGNMQNGFLVSGADEVSINGFMTRGYKANGFFVVNVNGYTLNHLVARQTGVYGLYAFNSIGGRMLNSEAYYVNDGAFYIGQTPPQDKPVQTLVKNVDGWGSPIGFSATNMRYVTITKSRFYNNGTGIVPNALDGEKFPPPEHNVITGNEIFWNNFNFHDGKPPFKVREEGTAALVPIGTGILLLGGRDTLIEKNRIYGNFLGGVGGLDSFLVPENPLAAELRGNTVRNNEFGLNGTDENGLDIIYAGQGSDNCFAIGASDTALDRAALSPCQGKNTFNQAAYNQMLQWAGENGKNGWKEHAHPPKKGITPLVVFGE
jgi:hypothetical protein